jgi:hypothetical protein
MKDGSRSRPKKLEKISFEEVMGAAGMSGFGALLEPRHGIEDLCWQPAAESRLKFLLKGAALAENVERQTDTLRSLNERLTRRLTSLAQALGMLSWMTGDTCARSIPSAPMPAPFLVAGEQTTLVMARHEQVH